MVKQGVANHLQNVNSNVSVQLTCGFIFSSSFFCLLKQTQTLLCDVREVVVGTFKTLILYAIH